MSEAGRSRFVPPLALSRHEAATALGVSIDYLDEHVLPDLRIVRRGRRKLIPTRELERWLNEAATFPLHEARPTR